jgi:hypothetical protein
MDECKWRRKRRLSRRLIKDPSYIGQEKLDGMRAVVHITKSGLRVFSRNAGVDDQFRPMEKTSSLPHLAQTMIPPLVATVLDWGLFGREDVQRAVVAGPPEVRLTHHEQRAARARTR